MPRPVHFELSAGDPDRALKFYRDVFAWSAQKWDGPMEYWMIRTGDDAEPGINGGLMRRSQQSGTTNTMSVPNVDEYIARVTAAGGQVIMPKTEIQGVGWVAYCLDTEGNAFGMMQFAEQPG